MGIAPIPGIRGAGPASGSLAEREVEPPLALTRSDRMQEDAYQGSQQSADRGMEEEDAETTEDANVDEPRTTTDDSHVSFFA
jgi:hypothetical protein